MLFAVREFAIASIFCDVLSLSSPALLYISVFFVSCGLQPIASAFTGLAHTLETADYIFLLILQKMKSAVCSIFLFSLLLGSFQEEKWEMLICAMFIMEVTTFFQNPYKPSV